MPYEGGGGGRGARHGRRGEGEGGAGEEFTHLLPAPTWLEARTQVPRRFRTEAELDARGTVDDGVAAPGRTKRNAPKDDGCQPLKRSQEAVSGAESAHTSVISLLHFF